MKSFDATNTFATELAPLLTGPGPWFAVLPSDSDVSRLYEGDEEIEAGPNDTCAYGDTPERLISALNAQI